MSGDAQALLDQALQLPPGERELLVDVLRQSLVEMDPEIEQAWNEECLRRWALIESGEEKMIPGEVVEREVDEMLRESRSREA